MYPWPVLQLINALVTWSMFSLVSCLVHSHLMIVLRKWNIIVRRHRRKKLWTSKLKAGLKLLKITATSTTVSNWFTHICIFQHRVVLSGEVLAWLSVWSKVQMVCIWSSWCHCHCIISCSSKIQNGLPFWCRLTQCVLEKRRLNGCSSSSSSSSSIFQQYFLPKASSIYHTLET